MAVDDPDDAAPLPPEAVEALVDGLDPADGAAAADLMPVVYDELRRLARRYVRGERARSIQATELVHEAYLRLARDQPGRWQGRTHFLALAAIGMRRVLVERARARGAEKRGGGRAQVTLDDALAAAPGTAVDVLAIDEALSSLAALDARQARVVELRFFGGLTVEETAEATGVSPATVKRDWTLARAWLKRALATGRGGAQQVPRGDGDHGKRALAAGRGAGQVRREPRGDGDHGKRAPAAGRGGAEGSGGS